MTVVRSLYLSALVALLAGGAGAGCDKKAPVAAGGGGGPPPPKVTAAKPIVRNVTQWDEYTGRLEAVESVEVLARVSGFVETVNFTEGAIVHKGDVLFTIDPRLFQAQLETAQAAVVQADAKLQVAKSELARTERVAKTGSVSADELESKRGTVAENQGLLAESKAKVDAAALNVEWCKVTSPITGRISDKRISAGAMITGGGQQGVGTLLTTIQSVDPIYCYVEPDEASVLKYQRLSREKKRVSARDEQIPCWMELIDETGFPHEGIIDFVDNRIKSTTGTLRWRGVFKNADGALLPGAFARFRVAGEELKDAMLVIDDAVGTDQDRKYVYVLHGDNTIERRTVKVGPLMEELRVVESGLSPEDAVIVNGQSMLMMVRPGGTVNPTVAPMPEHRLQAAVDAAATASRAATAKKEAATQSTEAAK